MGQRPHDVEIGQNTDKIFSVIEDHDRVNVVINQVTGDVE